MNKKSQQFPKLDLEQATASGALQSPIRPRPPEDTHSPASNPEPAQSRPVPTAEENPTQTLDHIRQKMESVASEFAEGKLNRTQFAAIYGHYMEQRAIIEKLIERNPENDAWKQVAKQGRTTFLRSHFEAQPQYFLVFRHRERQPLMTGGTIPQEVLPHLAKALKQVWSLSTLPTARAARKEINDGQWLAVAIGEHSLSLVIYSLQPSQAQCDLVMDLHNDFERANRISLQRKLPVDRMVFPQRSLLK